MKRSGAPRARGRRFRRRRARRPADAALARARRGEDRDGRPRRPRVSADEPMPAAPPSPALRALGPELWEAELHLREGGMHLRMRMTVVRRADGTLWLHSPIHIDDALGDRLAELGPVRDIVAPNRFHHRFAAAAKERYPNATLWGAPGLARRRKRIPFDATLSQENAWGGDLEAIFLAGAPFWSEHVFFHPASGTLICTDLCSTFARSPIHRPAFCIAAWASGGASEPIASGAGWPRIAPPWPPAWSACWRGTSSGWRWRTAIPSSSRPARRCVRP